MTLRGEGEGLRIKKSGSLQKIIFRAEEGSGEVLKRENMMERGRRRAERGENGKENETDKLHYRNS